MTNTIVSWLLLVSSLIAGTGGAEPLPTARVTYETSVIDQAGVAHYIRFDGSAVAEKLGGTLTVDGELIAVAAIIGSDGVVSGRFLNADRSPRGMFWGRRSGTQLKGSFDLGGEVGDWSVPASKLPVPR